MLRRPVLRNVAQAAGVHLSTAARALKNDPRISAKTRLKVRAAAKQLGYVSDPMMAAFAAYRQKVRTTSFRGTLAWVTNFPELDGWHNQASDLYHVGAKERALELGYDLQHFWLRDPGMTARRAGTILIARGIRGLLVCPMPRHYGHLSIKWDQFASVAFGYSMARPKIHRVSTSHFRSVVTAVRQLRALGYRRIGWACPRQLDSRTEHLWTAAFHSEVQTLPESRDIPTFTEIDYPKSNFLDWFKKWRIEAVVTSTDKPLIEWLTEAGYKVPRDAGVAFLNLQGSTNFFSGVDERSKVIGTTAVDLLASMLQRGEYGIPQDALTVLVEGTWIAGKTVAVPPTLTDTGPRRLAGKSRVFAGR